MQDDTKTLATGLAFPECPRWRGDGLYFSDIHAGIVRSMTLDGKLTELARLPHRVSGLGWSAESDLLMVSVPDTKILRLRGGKLTLHADMAPLCEGPCNDMIADAQGNCYAGNIGYDHFNGAPLKPGRLIRVDAAGKISVAADDLIFPNGIRFTPDGRTAIVAESFAHRLTAFRVAEDGSLVDRRVFAELGDCVPDGIALDAEGAVWVADAATNRVLRVLDGGRVAQVVHTGALRAFACELGGPDGRHLFVCAAPQTGLKSLELLQGAILLAKVEVPSAEH